MLAKSVSISKGGIGYGARAIANAKSGNDYVEPTPANVLATRYLLSRYLYLYLNKPSDQALTPLQQEFIRLILSEDRQGTVETQGLYPLTANIIKEELKKLGMQLRRIGK